MNVPLEGTVAVIFASRRAATDPDGYEAASHAMATLAAQQPGYLGHHAARGDDGFGITVSYWTDEAAAKAWRNHPDHQAVRAAGRDRWYESWQVSVATIGRSYGHVM